MSYIRYTQETCLGVINSIMRCSLLASKRYARSNNGGRLEPQDKTGSQYRSYNFKIFMVVHARFVH